MKSDEIAQRVLYADSESVERCVGDLPIYVYEIARQAIPEILAYCFKTGCEADETYQRIFLAGWLSAKVAQKIEIEDLFMEAE